MNIKNGISVPVSGHISQLYKDIYKVGKQIPKRDRFGIHAQVENKILESHCLSIEIALSEKREKSTKLRELQINLEIGKHLIRLSHEIGIYRQEQYWNFEKQLRNISRQIAGWYNYTKRPR